MSREDAALWERLSRFWADVARQDAAALREWFAPEAEVYWHCTDERFTAEEYIRANCEYPRGLGGRGGACGMDGGRLCFGRSGVAEGQERPFSCGVFFPFRGGQDHPLR